MIILTGFVTFDPDDWPALEAAWDVCRAATLQEAGCVSFDLYPVRGATDRALLFERWVDFDALEAHWRTPHVAAFRAAREPLGEVTFDTTIYDAAERA